MGRLAEAKTCILRDKCRKATLVGSISGEQEGHWRKWTLGEQIVQNVFCTWCSVVY